MKIKDCRLISISEKGDDRGRLMVVEGSKDIPFNIQRIFYICETVNGVSRGNHANKKSSFFFLSIKGSCKIKVFDGEDYREFILEETSEGLYVPKNLWKSMYDFSKDSILLVFSDENYNDEEYIRDINEYIKFTQTLTL
ncbi:MAG: FdtA/QdtA family cupin domain-containing protein [Anaerorhabdus sp.]|uniref:sugar 3,4-ketoisomerase n=1 Tax=Anaerorhabdus sp. TaxID=1872524 RepID=UPI002FCA540B